MKESIFRERSLDKISSPEQINDYIRVARPSIWLVLVALVLILCTAIIWGITGRIEASIAVQGTAQNGIVAVEVKQEQRMEMDVGSKAYAGNLVGTVTSVAANGDFYDIEVELEGIPDGTAEIRIVNERIAPISFLFG